MRDAGSVACQVCCLNPAAGKAELVPCVLSLNSPGPPISLMYTCAFCRLK